MLRQYVTSAVVMGMASVALGDLQIRQWNPNITSGYTIDDNERRIEITTGHATEVFKFEAYDDVTNEPETINEITVQSGAGTVLLAVIGDDGTGRTFGADNLKKLDLSGASSSTLVQVKIEADLGEEGPTIADTLADAGGLTSTFEVGGNLLDDLSITGDADGAIIVNGAGPHTGDITISGSAIDIQINGGFGNTIEVGGPLYAMTVNGNLMGNLELASVQGLVDVNGDIGSGNGNYFHVGELAAGGTIECENIVLDTPRERWLRIGPPEGGTDPQLGNVLVHSTVSGTVWFTAPFGGEFNAAWINAQAQADPEMSYGGVWFDAGTTDEMRMSVDSIERGWIAARHEARGEIILWSGMQPIPGEESAILSEHLSPPGAAGTTYWDVYLLTDGYPGSRIYVGGDMYGYIALGDWEGQVEIGGDLLYGPTTAYDIYAFDLVPGSSITVHGDVSGTIYFFRFGDSALLGPAMK